MKPTLVARFTIEGLRIARLVETSNGSLTQICIYEPYIIPIITTNITKEYRNIPNEAFTVALFLTNLKEVAKFSIVKTKASSKRLFHNVRACKESLGEKIFACTRTKVVKGEE